MELDAEGGASFEQLQELIRKECDKRDKKYCSLEQKYKKLEESLKQPQQKTQTRGAKEASQTKRSHPQQRLERLKHNVASLPQNVEHIHMALDNLTHKKEKPTIPPTLSQTNTEETPRSAGTHDHNRRKKLPLSIGTSSDYSPEQIKTTFWIRRRSE